jgi:hypothetical protein
MIRVIHNGIMDIMAFVPAARFLIWIFGTPREPHFYFFWDTSFGVPPINVAAASANPPS